MHGQWNSILLYPEFQEYWTKPQEHQQRARSSLPSSSSIPAWYKAYDSDHPDLYRYSNKSAGHAPQHVPHSRNERHWNK